MEYTIVIKFSAEDGGYIATVPDLPGCSAFGETRVEAVEEIRLAIASWIMAAEAAGNNIPAPSLAP